MAEYNNSEMQNNEIQRNARENERINNENERITNEIERDAREKIRIEKEIERQENEVVRQQRELDYQEFKDELTSAMTTHKNEVSEELESVNTQLTHIIIDVTNYKNENNSFSDAINDIIAKHEGHIEIFFPRGDYELNNLNVTSNITLKSNGDANIYTSKLFETNSEKSENITLENLNIISTNESDEYIISIEDPFDFKIHNCILELKQPFLRLHTINYYATDYKHNISIRNNVFKGVSQTTQSFCINVENAVHCGCIDSNIFEGLKVASCIRLFESSISDKIIGCMDWEITNNTFYNVLDLNETVSGTGKDCNGLYIRGNYIKILNNTFEKIQGNHIDIQSTENLVDDGDITKKGSFSIISNNHFINDISNTVFNGEALLHCRTSDVFISDNVFINRSDNNYVSCIVCKWGSLSKISNNSFRTKTYESCIVLYSTNTKNTQIEQSLITGNIFTNELDINSIELQVFDADFGDVLISNNITNTNLISFKKFSENEFVKVEEFNNIATGKIFDFSNSSPKTINSNNFSDYTFYVSPDGNDLNFANTDSKPARSIQKIIDMLPEKYSDYSVTINVSAGDYRGYPVYINNFNCNSSINIVCDDNVQLDRLFVQNCTNLKVNITNGVINNTTGDGVRNLSGNSVVTLTNCSILSKWGINNNSTTYVNNVYFDCSTHCVLLSKFSRMILNDCTFSTSDGNSCSVCEGSVLVKNNSVTTGTDTVVTGGIIYE